MFFIVCKLVSTQNISIISKMTNMTFKYLGNKIIMVNYSDSNNKVWKWLIYILKIAVNLRRNYSTAHISSYLCLELKFNSLYDIVYNKTNNLYLVSFSTLLSSSFYSFLWIAPIKFFSLVPIIFMTTSE